MLNSKQQAIIDWAKAQLEFFETSNDVKSPTHYNDIEQTLYDELGEEHDLTPLELFRLKSAITLLYETIKDCDDI